MWLADNEMLIIQTVKHKIGISIFFAVPFHWGVEKQANRLPQHTSKLLLQLDERHTIRFRNHNELFWHFHLVWVVGHVMCLVRWTHTATTRKKHNHNERKMVDFIIF